MGPFTLSVILYAAAHAGQSCESVFEATATRVNPQVQDQAERPFMRELATAACQTTNPDVIWQIVNQESSFRFLIARDNNQGRIYQGREAIQFLSRLKPLKGEIKHKALNVDIGAMQFNWNWHQAGFGNDPIKMLSPAAQINYFIDKFGESIHQRCLKNWVGCYHNASDANRGLRYQEAVRGKGQVLQLQTIRFLRVALNALSAEQRAQLPRVRREEFFKVLSQSREMALPGKDLLRFFIDPELMAPEALPLLPGIHG